MFSREDSISKTFFCEMNIQCAAYLVSSSRRQKKLKSSAPFHVQTLVLSGHASVLYGALATIKQVQLKCYVLIK